MPDNTSSSANNWAGTETWQIRKPAVHSSKGLVASHHHAASKIGAEVLADGGNAIDAAIATSLMIGTVEPWMSGLGGGGFLLYFDAETQKTQSVEFGMRAPWSINPADYPLVEGQDSDLFGWPAVLENRNVQGPMSIAAPGYLAGITAALDQFGTKPFGELVSPAIDSARSGMTIDWYATLKIASAAPVLSQYAHSASTYLPNGFVPAGEWGGPMPKIILGKLADTLDTLRQQGSQDFYHGDIARSIATDTQAIGSSLRESDLQRYQPILAEADSHRYRDATIFAAPGMSAGPTLRDTLTRLEKHWQPGPSPDTAAYKAYAQSLYEAYEHRLKYLGDTDDSQAPGCTTHLTVVDKKGNMVALTQTLLSVFGSKVMLPETGILMNNGLMWFDPRPDRPNSMAAGKRPLSNMCPAMFLTQNGNRYALGASGGRRIMPSVMQLISFVTDFGMSVEDAMHQGRIDVSGAPVICVDEKLDETIAQALHEAHADKNQAIMRVPNGVYPALMACPNLVCSGLDEANSAAAFVTSPWAEVAAE